MKNFTVRPATTRTLRFACATVLAAVLASILPQQVYAQRETPPPVPDLIQVAAGQRLFLAGHAYGTIRYNIRSALGRRLRLDVVRPASNAVPQRCPAGDDPFPQRQS